MDTAALGMFGVVALLAVATFSRFYLISWLGERIGGDLRRDIFDRVISLSPAFLKTARTGDILTRLTSDISTPALHQIEQKTNEFGATLPDWNMESIELNAVFASGRRANPSACTLAELLFVSLNLRGADQP